MEPRGRLDYSEIYRKKWKQSQGVEEQIPGDNLNQNEERKKVADKKMSADEEGKQMACWR